ncbi:MAG: aldo/keto reductase [bacterium]
MRYKLLGRSGLRVAELCLGTMTFGSEWGWGSDKSESRRVFDMYLDQGGNFIDTANRYTEGTSEKFVGEFIADKREQIVLATKFTLKMRNGDPNAAGNHRKNMVQSLEASLKRLNTDYVDLYWLHAWDFTCGVDEVMRALDDMVRAGKVLYLGISDTPAWIVSQANMLADLRGWAPFVGLQIEYSLIERAVERELLPMARSLDLGVTPWGILGGGMLTGKYANAGDEPKRMQSDSPRLSEHNQAIAAEVGRVASELERSSSQVAINWLRRQAGTIIPILGARTREQLADNLGCLDFSLSDEQVERLSRISNLELGFPHDFTTKEPIRDIMYAGTYDQLDNHHRR